MKEKNQCQYTVSSGNVFEDLNIEEHESELLKAKISACIFKLLRKNYQAKNQLQMATILGVDQPEISKLKNGQFSRFSLERLLNFLNQLHYDIDIKVSRAKGHAPHQEVHLKIA